MEEETAQTMEEKKLTYWSVGPGSDLNPYFVFLFFLALGTMLKISVGGGG